MVAETSTDERYVREWLAFQAAGGCIIDREAGRREVGLR